TVRAGENPSTRPARGNDDRVGRARGSRARIPRRGRGGYGEPWHGRLAGGGSGLSGGGAGVGWSRAGGPDLRPDGVPRRPRAGGGAGAGRPRARGQAPGAADLERPRPGRGLLLPARRLLLAARPPRPGGAYVALVGCAMYRYLQRG